MNKPVHTRPNSYPPDAECLRRFPEILNYFSADELGAASEIGSYIFHEDYFVKFIERSSGSETLLARIANYIEDLACSECLDVVNLAEVGILEGIIAKELTPIAPFLGAASRRLAERVLSRFDVDPAPWRRRPPKRRDKGDVDFRGNRRNKH